MEQITELENYIEEQPQPKYEQLENTIFYEKLYDDKHLGNFTESSDLAYQLGWYDNQISKDDVEQSEINGWTYLKGYAPQKTENMILIEQYQSEIIELKKYLSDTDYKAIKYAEGQISEEEYASVRAERQGYRDRINYLEGLLCKQKPFA